ncbi:MAG: hypothetical protein SGJ01_17850 [Gemmatimonadota bacterium]|nr:hypothetical protein [Gemmatimonadota bacterium]
MTFMRRLVLAAVPALLLACEDTTSGPGGAGFATVTLQAVAPPSMARFAPNLAVEQVRVRLYRTVGDISRDIVQRVLPFNVNTQTLNVSLSFVTSVAAETLSVQLDYETLTSLVLFSSVQSVEVRAGVPTAPQLMVPSYIGPGSNVAFIGLSPLDTTLTAGDTMAFTVSALDGQQQPVTSVYISWSSSDQQIPVNAAGVLRTTAGTSRVITVTARTPPTLQDTSGVSASTTVTILGPQALIITPDSVEKLPGGTQQFSVTGPTGPFTWSVNGTDGGNTTFGTVDGTGFYQAPVAVPTPALFQICARVTATPATSGCAKIVISPIPSAGTDVIVINDMNLFDNAFMGQDPNNRLFAANLVNYTATGSRSNGTVVMYDRGRSSSCFLDLECADAANFTIDSVLTANGFSIVKVDSVADWSSIPANVKVIFLWNPTIPYTRNDINGFKAFASQGGRIVFLGEHVGFYFQAGIDTENQFLADMGSQFTNVGAVISCIETIPPAQIAQHQTTAGLTSITIACASQALPGPNDFPLFFESTGLAVAGVAKISTIPLPVPPAAVRATTRPPAIRSTATGSRP